MKNILIINSSYNHCGVDEYCLNIYNLFKDRFNFYFGVKKNSDFEKTLKKSDINKKIVSIFYIQGNYYKNLISLKNFIVKNNIDILHVNTAADYYLLMVGYLFKREFRNKNIVIKKIVTRHNSFNLNYFPNNIFFKNSDIIIAVSNYVKNKLIKQFKFLKNKVKVVYNSIDLDINNISNTGNINKTNNVSKVGNFKNVNESNNENNNKNYSKDNNNKNKSKYYNNKNKSKDDDNKNNDKINENKNSNKDNNNKNNKNNKINDNKNEKNNINFNIGFIGRITEQKGLHILLEGFKLFVDKLIDKDSFYNDNNFNDKNYRDKNYKDKKYKDKKYIDKEYMDKKYIDKKYVEENDFKPALIIAGDFSDKNYEKKIRTYIKSNNLDNFVKFLGFVKNKKEFYDKIDILVVPSLKSWEEAFGLIVLEAFSFKKPVISSDSGALNEINIDGKTGFVYLDDDPLMLSERLYILYKNTTLLKQMGLNAFNRVNADFTKESYIKKMEKIYMV